MAANIPNIEALIQAGIDPKTGLPRKFIAASNYKENIKRQLRIKHEQQFIRRFTWYNLPDGLDGELIERILFYRYSGMFFYMETNDTFYFLPYTLDGEIDVYGRYTGVTPIAFGGTAINQDSKERPWITGLVRKPMYDIQLEMPTMEDFNGKCILLNDYCKQMSQKGLPRAEMDDSIIDIEAEMIPYLRTTLQNQTGVTAVRVNSQDEYSNVNALNNQVNTGALEGSRYIAAIGNVDFQDFGETPTGKSADYMQALESIDNYRLGLLGIDQAGVFQKSSYINDQTQALGGGAVGLIMDDGLAQRQDFCDKVNSLFGLGIWCEPSENIIGDKNMDGMIYDGQDQSGTGEGAQPAGGIENV